MLNKLYKKNNTVIRVLKNKDDQLLIIDCKSKKLPVIVNKSFLTGFSTIEEDLQKETGMIMLKYDEMSQKQKNILLGYYSFVDLFCDKDLIKLRLLEKISRFCQYPNVSADISNTPRYSFELMQAFKDNGGSFSALIFETLNNVDCLVKKGRTPNCKLKDRLNHQAFEFKFLDKINSKYLNTTIVVYPFEVTDVWSFQRIIDTYSQITTLESEGREIELKYILVPCYFEIFVIDCSLVNRTLFNNFKLGNKTFQEAIYYHVNGKTYALIKKDIVMTSNN